MPPGPHVQYVLGTRTSLGRWVRTAYCGTPGDDRQLSGDVIVNLSLAADATMTYEHDRERARPPVRVLLPRRSLQIQTGDVRFNWRHAIHNADLPPTGRRVSITFRRAKLPP